MTEVAKDCVGHAGGQQERRQGTSTVPLPLPRAQTARGKGVMGQDAPIRTSVTT
jgi:hypothetical protein